MERLTTRFNNGQADYIEPLKFHLLVERLCDFEDLLSSDDEPYDLSRLRELVEADREGRCVVLPCKEGGKITIDGKEYDADHWNIHLSCFTDSSETKSGKQVRILSREEAEKALQEVSDG